MIVIYDRRNGQKKGMEKKMERVPKSGELYRHFKNRLYQIVTVAVHSETGEQMVIYQALYGDYSVYARPLPMFVSEVDHVKYPEVTQKYRFERVEAGDLVGEKTSEGSRLLGSQKSISDNCGVSMCENAKLEHDECEEAGVEPKLMAFFDAEDLEEKYNILVSMRDIITDHMINNMAVVLDVVIPEGDVSDRYEELKNCIRTKQRYESSRLR